MAAGMDITLRGDGLDVATLARIARDPRVRVVPDPAAMKRVEHCRALIDRIVERYRIAFEQRTDARQPLPHVYGVTTGFGEFKKVDIHPDDLERLQYNILPSHAVGVGDSLDPDDPANYFPAEVVRAALALRLNV
ncbi:MAG: aromatic amino acid ammonia-lyase, partial [Chloroflexi bacterium]|nr:aromatic amino acid ammonia-lyase [Chloroflexota bacterium]